MCAKAEKGLRYDCTSPSDPFLLNSLLCEGFQKHLSGILMGQWRQQGAELEIYCSHSQAKGLVHGSLRSRTSSRLAVQSLC